MLSFIPKISGMVALIKLLFVAGGGAFAVPSNIIKMLWVLAVLTMTVGNVLGLLQFNVKRVFAYSSIAHSGYMLAGLTALASAWQAGQRGFVEGLQEQAMVGVLFYLAAYGVMNAAAFGVLMLLPSRTGQGSAETFEDIAGQGRNSPALGLAMAVSCFSLIGLPLTVGFFGKLYLIAPVFRSGNLWLVVIMLINAAISAGYYLKIVATMFLRQEEEAPEAQNLRSLPVSLAVVISAFGTILLGVGLPATQVLTNTVTSSARVDERIDPALPQSADVTTP
jgi:NADH-quinone oxidoreductase subunit N